MRKGEAGPGGTDRDEAPPFPLCVCVCVYVCACACAHTPLTSSGCFGEQKENVLEAVAPGPART